MGTGWFIGPHTLMTAGHVVHIKNSGVPGRDGWVRRINVMPGRNGANLPYGAITSTSFRSVVGWTSNGDQNYDYGAIILPSNLGLTTGWFGFGGLGATPSSAPSPRISPATRPTSRPGRSGITPAPSRRSTRARCTTTWTPSAARVAAPSTGSSTASRYGIAIHAYGGTTSNNGTRIVSPVFNNMVAWKA